MVNLASLPEETAVRDENSLVHLRTSAGRDISIKFSALKNNISGGGEWKSTTTYVAGNIVTHQDGIYIARRGSLNVAPSFDSNQDWLIKYKYDFLASIPIGGLLFVEDYTTAKSPGNTLWAGQWASLRSSTYGEVWSNPSQNENSGVDSNIYFYWNPQDLRLYDSNRTAMSSYGITSINTGFEDRIIQSLPNRVRTDGTLIPRSFAGFNSLNPNLHLRPRVRTMCGYRLEGYGDLATIITGGKG